MKYKVNLIADLKRITDIAHAGGLCGLDEYYTLCAIRDLTREYFDVERTEEQMKTDVRDATLKASPFMAYQLGIS